MSDVKMGCDKCVYEANQKCHRYPPSRASGVTEFPRVEWRDWCGEFKLSEVDAV